MFTGLIEETGVVRSLTRVKSGRLVVASERVAARVSVGDSVSVSGVCLTVTSASGGEMSFDVAPETFSRSTLGDLRPGDRVNLESSLTAGSPIGGHFVQGHVDAVGRIASITPEDGSWVIRFEAPSEIMRYVVEKGSVAVDGISLTAASRDDLGFTVSVIPHTLSTTTLHLKRPGDRVNLEADIIAKYVERFTARFRGSGPVTEETLRDAGFIL